MIEDEVGDVNGYCWLDCPECGDDAVKSLPDGTFHEDMEATCPTCGSRVGVRVDEVDEEFVGDDERLIATSRLLDEEDE